MTILTLTFDLLTLRVFRVQRFSCPTHVLIFIILRLSVTELQVLNIWSHFRYLKESLHMRRVTWPPTKGKNSPHFFAYSLYNFYGATMTIKGSLYWNIPILKRFLAANQSKSFPEMAVFRKFKGLNIKHSYRDPLKALPYLERRHLTYFA